MSALHEKDSLMVLEAARDAFEKLTLSDIYGRVRKDPKKIPITPEQWRRFSSADEDGKLEGLEFARAHGIDKVGAWEGGRDCFLHESISTTELAEWVPYVAERGLILQTAYAVSDKAKPLILEVGCGTGLMSSLLGLDEQAHVLGIDKDPEAIGRNRFLPVPDVTLTTIDIWDIVSQLGSQYQHEIAELRNRLFASMRDAISFERSEFLGGIFGSESYTDEIAQLQSLAPQFIRPSSTDLVICSFMHTGTELTVPIRDGIFPKAIIYVRPTNGISGAGDYYYSLEHSAYDIDRVIEYDESEGELEVQVAIGPYTHLSYNPGDNYLTVARWFTPWNSDHDLWAQQFRRVTAEGIIQVRKDVTLKPVNVPTLRRYVFDEDIEEAFGNDESRDNFLSGINAVKVALLR